MLIQSKRFDVLISDFVTSDWLSKCRGNVKKVELLHLGTGKICIYITLAQLITMVSTNLKFLGARFPNFVKM